MRKYAFGGAVALSIFGAAVMAHNGAKGVVLERMNGMSAMRNVMRDLAPMMQGQTSYDVAAVQAGAASLLEHSGENMNRMFPEEPVAAASFAKPEIWRNWERFVAMSEDLRTYAHGLSTAAPNGIAAPVPAASGDMAGMADHSGMQTAATPQPFSLAELMGVTSVQSDRTDMTAGLTGTETPSVAVRGFADMGAGEVFELVGQTCSSCHALFRNGS